MTYYDDLYEHAVDNYYLVTTDDANNLGIPPVELAKLAKRGRLQNLGRGLYRLTRYVPSEFDPYAIAVARVGGSAYLYGESVLALLKLAPTNPDRIFVATSVRTRKRLPEGIQVVSRKDAILSCQDTIMSERLNEATHRARAEGFLTKAEFDELEEALV